MLPPTHTQLRKVAEPHAFSASLSVSVKDCPAGVAPFNSQALCDDLLMCAATAIIPNTGRYQNSLIIPRMLSY